MADFDYIPIVADAAALDIQVATCQNFGTKTGSESARDGRLYGQVDYDPNTDPDNFDVNFYTDPARTALFATQALNVAEIGSGDWFEVAGPDAEVIRYRILKLTGPPAGVAASPRFTAIFSFATDGDVYPSADSQAALPGYSPTDGLRHYHAQAMREILTSALPARVPNLFGGLGMAAFVTFQDAEVEIPDIRKLANADALRIAQGALVRALAAETMEHLQEWRDIAAAARTRYAETMDAIQLANAPAETDAADSRPEPPDTGGIGFSSFVRG